MAFEKRWAEVPVQLLTADGTTDGILTVSDSRIVKVKQIVLLKSNTQTTQVLQVKRVISKTIIHVGSVQENIDDRADVSAFLVADGASISNPDPYQPRPKIGVEDFARAVYEEEPTCAIRMIGVDQLGNPWNETNPIPELASFIRNGTAQQVVEDTVDPTNNRPLPVKLSGVQGDVLIQADNLNLEVQLEGEYDAVNNPKPDSVGVVLHERGLTQDSASQIERATAKRGLNDTDTVSQDVALHDHNGDRYSAANPLPVDNSFEKFFALINASNWMKLAVYDQVLPVYSNGNTTLTLQYLEDSVVIGEAVVNFSSPTVWDLQLNRYINDDDGSFLLNDDDAVLNLE